MKIQPLKSYAQLKIALIAIIMAITANCFGQTYECGVSTSADITFKFSTTIQISDSTVVFTTNGKSLSSKRVPSSYNIYFTDGVITNSLLITESTGRKKGFDYTHMVVMRANINIQSAPAILYCTKKD